MPEVSDDNAAAMWAGSCDSCDFNIYVDGDGKMVPAPAEWDGFPICPVCGGTVYFDAHSETQWNREDRLMQTAVERQFRRIRTILVAEAKWGDIPPSVFEDLYVLLGGKKEDLE